MIKFNDLLEESMAQILAKAEAKKKQQDKEKAIAQTKSKSYVAKPSENQPPPSPKTVYTNPKTKQKVIVTGHVQQDRAHRAWWKDYNDPKFTNFVTKTLEKLNQEDREDLNYKDEWAVLSKDKTRGMIISLRYTSNTDKNDSFAIMTVLNSKAKDSASNKEVFVNVDDGHKITLTESKKSYKILYTI